MIYFDISLDFISVFGPGCLSRVVDPHFFRPGSRVKKIREPKKLFLSFRKYTYTRCSSRIRILILSKNFAFVTLRGTRSIYTAWLARRKWWRHRAAPPASWSTQTLGAGGMRRRRLAPATKTSDTAFTSLTWASWEPPQPPLIPTATACILTPRCRQYCNSSWCLRQEGIRSSSIPDFSCSKSRKGGSNCSRSSNRRTRPPFILIPTSDPHHRPGRNFKFNFGKEFKVLFKNHFNPLILR